VVLDDLGSHAKYMREISLLAGEVPGRESYPGDLFFQQARLLERGGRFNHELGCRSITILPVLETNIEDISNLVSTNLVSATDGHLFFSPLLHAEGQYPALVPEESVTRVGRKTQSRLVTQMSLKVQALLAEYERQKRYSQFGTQLSPETRRTLSRGEIMRVLLAQEQDVAIGPVTQVLLLAAVFTDLFEGKNAVFAKANRAALARAIDEGEKRPELEALITSAKRGTMSVEQFVKKMATAVPYLQTVCQ
jgi:F-type H+-transporting ATPase subunit alpha